MCARRLFTDDVSLERTWEELNAAHTRGRAAASTVEALMFGLRQRRTSALKEPKVLHRLSELSAQQLREVAVRLQKLTIEPAWPAEDVEVLVAVRSRLHD